PRTVNRLTYIFESNFGDTASIEQEHPLTSTGHQFSSSTSSYVIEESLQIQSNFVHNQEYIDTIYAMLNNYMP
ncbi:16670_t:CDS:1, partial [Gigaspora margarita]